MELLDRLALIPEFHCQPIKEFRVRGRLPHSAKIIWGIDDPPAKMILPNAIGNTAPGQRLVRPGQPLCECHSPIRLIMTCRQFKFTRA